MVTGYGKIPHVVELSFLKMRCKLTMLATYVISF